MNKKFIISFIVADILIIAAAVYFIYFRTEKPLLIESSSVNVAQILTTKGDPEKKDKVLFSDGTSLDDVGFDIVQVGVLNEPSPVFLFKSYSCRGCEPVIDLIVYQSLTKTYERLPYPGSHFLYNVESGEEIQTSAFAAAYGACDNYPAPALLLAERTRAVDSNGAVLVAEQWSDNLRVFIFDAQGNLTIRNEARDGLTLIKNAIGEKCLVIEPEDRSDY